MDTADPVSAWIVALVRASWRIVAAAAVIGGAGGLLGYTLAPRRHVAEAVLAVGQIGSSGPIETTRRVEARFHADLERRPDAGDCAADVTASESILHFTLTCRDAGRTTELLNTAVGDIVDRHRTLLAEVTTMRGVRVESLRRDLEDLRRDLAAVRCEPACSGAEREGLAHLRQTNAQLGKELQRLSEATLQANTYATELLRSARTTGSTRPGWLLIPLGIVLGVLVGVGIGVGRGGAP